MNGAQLRRWAQQLLSGKDNSTPDLARYAWLIANLAIIGTAAAADEKVMRKEWSIFNQPQPGVKP
jgi:hypothetical protein